MSTASPSSKQKITAETTSRSDVIVGPNFSKTLADALTTLHDYNQQLGIYTNSGKLTQVVVDERDNARLDLLTPESLNVKLLRCIRFWRPTRTGRLSVPPPPRLAPLILAMTCEETAQAVNDQGPAPLFPALESIRNIPLMQPDGSLVTQRGYHASTRAYFHLLPTLQNLVVPETVTRRDLQDALEVLEDLFCDFPFVDESSKAHAVAALLTGVVRNLVLGGVPMFVISATAPGTGKTLLALVILTLLLGEQFGVHSAPSTDDEWRKAITTALLAGAPAIVYDNVFYLDSCELAKLLTAPVWSDRLLGSNRQISIPVQTFLLATGNNVKLGGDLGRRCFWTKLDSQVANPYLRTEFRHSDLVSYTLAHRSRILAAVFTLVRGWIQAGCPSSQDSRLGSYENWCSTVGGILKHAGIPGFLANHAQIVERSSEEDTQIETLLRFILQEHPKPFTVAQFDPCWAFINPVEVEHPGFLMADYLPHSLLDFTKNKDQFSKRLAQLYRRIEGRRFGSDGIHMARVEKRGHVVLWQVQVNSQPPGNEDR